MHQSDFPTPRTVRNATAYAPAKLTRHAKRTAARFERRNVAAEIAATVAELHYFDDAEVDA